MTYDNIKSHKKPELHPLFRRYIFRKTTAGQIDPPPPSRFKVKFILNRQSKYVNEEVYLLLNSYERSHTFYFSCNYKLHQKCLNTKFFWSVFSRISTKYGDLLRKSNALI